MREFMDYIQSAFYAATGWNRDNSYSTLNATADALLGFHMPRGLRLTLSALATPHFASAYQLGTVGIVDGSISYLYSNVALGGAVAQGLRETPLPDLLRSFRPLQELPRDRRPAGRVAWSRGLAGLRGDAMAYGRLYLPASMLEALVVRRLTPALQLQLSVVSDKNLRNGGTALGMVQYDRGRYGLETLASSDGGLVGVRGLYNFGGDAGDARAPGVGHFINGNGEKERIYGRFSAGAELYYGTLNKSGGMSLGGRFATLPAHRGTPLTTTLTINPPMGNISASYAVMAGGLCSLATKLDFNVYSYESAWAIGMELWRKKAQLSAADADEGVPIRTAPRQERSFQAKLEWRLDDPPAAAVPRPAKQERKERSMQAKMEWRLDEAGAAPAPPPASQTAGGDEDPYAGVLKAKLDQHLKIGLLWEGRVKSLLFSLGSGIDLRRPDSPFRTLGLEVQFSS